MEINWPSYYSLMIILVIALSIAFLVKCIISFIKILWDNQNINEDQVEELQETNQSFNLSRSEELIDNYHSNSPSSKITWKEDLVELVYFDPLAGICVDEQDTQSI